MDTPLESANGEAVNDYEHSDLASTEVSETDFDGSYEDEYEGSDFDLTDYGEDGYESSDLDLASPTIRRPRRVVDPWRPEAPRLPLTYYRIFSPKINRSPSPRMRHNTPVLLFH